MFFNFAVVFKGVRRREGEAPPEPYGAKRSTIEAGRTEPSPPKYRFHSAKVTLSNFIGSSRCSSKQVLFKRDHDDRSC
jgi:hypothetical protein